jgi:hypothetical protein
LRNVRHLPVFLVLATVSMGANAGNVVEDYVDFMGASGSFGLSLKQRELAEAQLRLALDEKYLQQINTIAQQIRKDRAAELLKGIQTSRQENAGRQQYLNRIRATLTALDNANMIIEKKLYVRQEIDAAIALLGDQKDAFLSLADLMQLTVTTALADRDDAVKEKQRRYHHLAETYELSADKMLAIAAELSGQAELVAAAEVAAAVRFRLQLAEQTIARRIEAEAMRIASNEAYLDELLAKT